MSPNAGGTSVEEYTFSDRKSVSHEVQTVVIQSVLDSVPSEIASPVHYPISA